MDSRSVWGVWLTDNGDGAKTEGICSCVIHLIHVGSILWVFRSPTRSRRIKDRLSGKSLQMRVLQLVYT